VWFDVKQIQDKIKMKRERLFGLSPVISDLDPVLKEQVEAVKVFHLNRFQHTLSDPVIFSTLVERFSASISLMAILAASRSRVYEIRPAEPCQGSM